MPSPEKQVGIHGCGNVRIPKNWRRHTGTEVLLLRRTACCLGSFEEMVRWDFSDSVRRLLSYASFNGKASISFSWDSRDDDLSSIKETPVAGAFSSNRPMNRFVVINFAGTEQSLSKSARKAGSEVIQLVSTLIGPMATKTLSKCFDFPVSGLVTAYDENGDDMCLCLSFFKSNLASYFTFRHVNARDIGSLRGLNLITVRELREEEY